jgi:hypothetical protein
MGLSLISTVFLPSVSRGVGGRVSSVPAYWKFQGIFPVYENNTQIFIK